MLPINFHKTFVPERRYIGALLHYAALGKQGNYQEIAEETGIPMGESTGKVPAILDYARGMGLVDLGADTKGATKQPILTSLGQVVYTTDRFLGEPLTQWVAHMNLCRGDIGAKAWWHVFAEGRQVLGSNFTRVQLENYLIGIFGAGNDRTGPMIRTYSDDAALGRAGVVAVSGDGLIERRQAPLLDAYAAVYSALILTFMETSFPNQMQVTMSDFAATGWFDVCLWSREDLGRLCVLLERKGLVTVDRQMRPWILDKRAIADEVWPNIFDDLA